MRLILNIAQQQSGRVRVELRTVEPEVTLSWQEITMPISPTASMPMMSFGLTTDVWDAIRREAAPRA